MNQGVHNVDLLQWLAGPVESVTAQQATLAHDSSAEDTTVATVRFTGGALGLISTTTATPPGAPATLTLHCERGAVEIGRGHVSKRVTVAARARPLPWQERYHATLAF